MLAALTSGDASLRKPNILAALSVHPTSAQLDQLDQLANARRSPPQ